MNTRIISRTAFITFLIACICSCANYEVVKSTANVKAPIPPNSLSLAWKSREPVIRVEKQERGINARPMLTEQEMSVVGPIARQSAKVIVTTLHALLYAGLRPYVATKIETPNEQYVLRTELKRLVIDTTGPRRAFLLAEVIAPNQPTPIWQVQLDIDASPTTNDEVFVKRCAAAITDEMKASKLIN